MRSPALPLLLAAALLGACTARSRPYRFASPMLGAASVPAPPLPGDPPPPPAELANRREAPRIRVVSAPTIREASAAAAAAVADQPNARATVRATLPTRHRIADETPPALRGAADLRALVGRRDKRAPIAVAVAWAHELGSPIELMIDTGSDVLAWAEQAHRLALPADLAAPGDFLVFDHVDSDVEADLVAVVIARDARGVTEFLYLGGGVIRRGFVDPRRPAMRRDADALVVNTFLRNGKRWPPKGTHYLAGELLSHVVHAR
jgi:hypothetical protein